MIKFETSTINTTGYYCLLFLPWPECFHSFFFSDPGDLPFFLGRKSSDSSSESCFSFSSSSSSSSSSSLAELPAGEKSFYKPFNDHFWNGKMVSEKLLFVNVFLQQHQNYNIITWNKTVLTIQKEGLKIYKFTINYLGFRTQTLSRPLGVQAWSNSPCSRWFLLLGRNRVELWPQLRRILQLNGFYKRWLSPMECGIYFLPDSQVEAYGPCNLPSSSTHSRPRSLVC